MILPIYQLIFYFFAAILVIAAIMVITSRNPVRAVLFLVLAFFASAVLWMLLQAEFLALVLLFVYVGAVMTLFLFVVMMLNPQLTVRHEKFVRHLPMVLFIVMAFTGMMLWAISAYHINFTQTQLIAHPIHYSNTRALGELLYTQYVYPFEIAGVILLVAIIAAIALAFHGRRHNRKSQIMAKQHQANKDDRLELL